ncbi:putative membrane protein [Streptococcus rupicaprae]|uniref:Membrane protein n=1 Tax=Streptococcus rupicaprae TaxID=759619 RepID=A0ABV2FGY4_9STRE
MNTNRPSSRLAVITMFFATMLVLHLITSLIFNVLPLPIKPTIIHIPVIVASIVYGPKIGLTLGFLMGIISVIHNTIFQIPTSYLFSPFVQGGNAYSLIIALVPRTLIGITPYFIYKLFKNRTGLVLSGALGSMTNTIFVLGGIFILFAQVYSGDIKAMLATVFGANALAEMVISAILTTAIVPVLLKLKAR